MLIFMILHQMCVVLVMARRSATPFGTGVINGYYTTTMGANNQTQALYKNTEVNSYF